MKVICLAERLRRLSVAVDRLQTGSGKGTDTIILIAKVIEMCPSLVCSTGYDRRGVI